MDLDCLLLSFKKSRNIGALDLIPSTHMAALPPHMTGRERKRKEKGDRDGEGREGERKN